MILARRRALRTRWHLAHQSRRLLEVRRTVCARRGDVIGESRASPAAHAIESLVDGLGHGAIRMSPMSPASGQGSRRTQSHSS
jgi:hypothetical protein